MYMYMYMYMYVYVSPPVRVAWGGVPGVCHMGWGGAVSTRHGIAHTHTHTYFYIHFLYIYTSSSQNPWSFPGSSLWKIHSLSHVDPGSSSGSINPLSGCRRSNIHKHPVEYGIAQIGVEIEQPLQILTVFHGLQRAFSEVCKMVHVLDFGWFCRKPKRQRDLGCNSWALSFDPIG